MTQEEKELLLKDLCSRLPYGVIVETSKGKGHVCDINLTIFGAEIGVNINPTVRDTFSINDVKPYLLPLSSMTEEQKETLKVMCDWNDEEADAQSILVLYQKHFVMKSDVIDWLHKNHFDYRGFIEKGLALDATGLNIY